MDCHTRFIYQLVGKGGHYLPEAGAPAALYYVLFRTPRAGLYRIQDTTARRFVSGGAPLPKEDVLAYVGEDGFAKLYNDTLHLLRLQPVSRAQATGQRIYKWLPSSGLPEAEVTALNQLYPQQNPSTENIAGYISCVRSLILHHYLEDTP